MKRSLKNRARQRVGDAYEALARRLPPRIAARIDLLVPRFRTPWHGPFNGQERRAEAVAEILRRFPLWAIVETGTYRGTTSAAFHSLARVPIVTVEVDPRLAEYSRLRFRKAADVSVVEADSRAYLAKLAHDESFPHDHVFFYLDAHWYRLPLAEELQTIGGAWTESIVMIDDFQVPDDPGYGFDEYGDGSRLILGAGGLDSSKVDASVFFPSARVDEETGARRGSVTLGFGEEATRILGEISALRPWPALSNRVPTR